MNIIRNFREKGITFIYISHRINEVLEISDKITVLRDGKYICTYINDKNLTEDDLVSAIVGQELSESLYSKKDFSMLGQTPFFIRLKVWRRKIRLTQLVSNFMKAKLLAFLGWKVLASIRYPR